MNKQQRDYEKAKQAKRRVEMKMEARGGNTMKKQLQEPASSVVSRLEPSEKDDLISRKALMQRLHDAGGCGAPPESWADGYDKAIDLAYGMAENAPTIDPMHAAGACYCRECRNYNKPRLGWCSHHMDRENPDDFCSWGKRREED